MNRRHFLASGSTLALLGALLPPHSSLAGSSSIRHSSLPVLKKSLKIGMVEGKMSILEKFRMLKALGYDGVELDSPSDLNPDEVLEAMQATGLQVPGVVCSAHWRQPLSHPDAGVRAACVEAMKTALADCKRYGGTTVLLVPAVVNAGVSYQDAYTRSQAEIRKLLPIAEREGVKIAIENVWNNFLLSPLEAARYIDEFENPWIGWYFDVGNIIRYGWPKHWIRILGKRILKVDIKEYSRKLAEDQGIWKGFDAELLEGDCNWPEVRRALADIGYEGWGSAEVRGGDRNRLEQISLLMDKINQA